MDLYCELYQKPMFRCIFSRPLAMLLASGLGLVLALVKTVVSNPNHLNDNTHSIMFGYRVSILAVLCLSLVAAQSTITLQGTIYDQSPTKNPDFEYNIGDDRGFVQTTIGSDRRPVYAKSGATNTVHGNSTFYQWYRDISGVTKVIPYTITLSNAGQRDPRIYTFSNNAFFPIDGQGWGNEGRSHNYHFCMEAHTRFTYQGGEVFSFTGDDDVFVFINDKLVIDLGGVHSAEDASVSLDTLGLTVGKDYRFDFFFCERHTTESNCKIQTSLYFYCSYYDRCGVCEGSGTSCPCTCNDNDLCTTDTCDLYTGACVYTQKNCNDGNLCTTDTCSGGSCVNTQKNCADSDLCTNDYCEPTTGSCKNVQKTCNDGNPCTVDSCSGGNCQYVDNTAVLCNDNNACTTDTCSSSTGCKNTQKTCRDGKSCTTDSCNTSNGNCVYTNITNCNLCQDTVCQPAVDACHPVECYPNNGSCAVVPISCNDNNPCTDDTCQDVGGTATCVFTPKSCPNSDACNVGVCVSGQCTTKPYDCSDGDVCTIDTCTVSGNTAVCNHTADPCSDGNICTDDFCQPGVGCLSTIHICEDTDLCNDYTCDPVKGCVATPINCTAVLGIGNDTYCTVASCDALAGCISFDRTCVDKDPDCFQGTCNEDEDKCDYQSRSSIACTLSPAEQGAVIGGAALAGIIIAAVAFVGIGSFGGKKAYDFWMQHANKIEGANDNPLYEDAGRTGNNPLYRNSVEL